MMGLLLVAALVFAATTAQSFFSSQTMMHVVLDAPVGELLAGLTLYAAVSYLTFVHTKADLLLRFLPGLIALLGTNVLLALGLGTALGLSNGSIALATSFVEMYNEAFSWMALVYTIRTLGVAPGQIVGLFLVGEGCTEALLRGLVHSHAVSDSTIILLVVLAVCIFFVVVLQRFYDAYCQLEKDRCAGLSGVRKDTNDKCNELAERYGLSSRESDVFVLLARGYGRRYIADELFIAEGTVSTHINRIYSKMGVHTKQEFLNLVQAMRND